MKHVLFLVLLSGCALTQRHARNNVDETRLKEAQAVDAEHRAPVQWANFQAAQQRAGKTAPETAERNDYEAEARLWLEAAIAIGEREKMASERLAEEKAQLDLDGTLAPLLAERAELARRTELLAAREIARSEAERSLQRAAQRRDLRVRIPREEQKQAAQALLARAQLIALTLETLKPDSAGLAKLRAQLTQLEASANKEPDLALARADQTLFFALSLLAELRGEEPSDDEKASLAEELALIGAKVSRGDQGLAGSFEDSEVRTFERLCALARSHGKGPVRLAARNAAQLRTSLAGAGCTGPRFAVVGGDALEVSFVAY